MKKINKITAFILSILLSTAALAENRVVPINDVDDMNEIKEAIEDAAADGRVMEIGDTKEWAEEALDRGEITEEEKNGILSRISRLADHPSLRHLTSVAVVNTACGLGLIGLGAVLGLTGGPFTLVAYGWVVGAICTTTSVEFSTYHKNRLEIN